MTPLNEKPLRIVLIAGEASGDFLGASLMRALKRQSRRPIDFFGVGGQHMKEEGLTPFFFYEKLNVLGITEVVRSIPEILKKITQAAREINDLNPDLVVTIDLQGFNKRLAKKLKTRSFPLVHYVAPTVWAYKEGRAKKLAQLFDHVLCLYPFEPAYFTPHGMGAHYVGHPLALTELEGKKEAFLKKYNAPEDGVYVALLPGSRPPEIHRLLPVFKESIRLLLNEIPSLQVVLPTVPDIASLVQEQTKGWPCPVHVLASFEERLDAYKACSFAIAASGTVALELARAKLPMLIAYKLSWLSGKLAKIFLKIKYVCLLNLIANKEVVPELLQENCTAEKITERALRYLKGPSLRAEQIKKNTEVLQTLRHTNTYESESAGEILLSLIKDREI